jgi:hypothetical protein
VTGATFAMTNIAWSEANAFPSTLLVYLQRRHLQRRWKVIERALQNGKKLKNTMRWW